MLETTDDLKKELKRICNILEDKPTGFPETPPIWGARKYDQQKSLKSYKLWLIEEIQKREQLNQRKSL